MKKLIRPAPRSDTIEIISTKNGNAMVTSTMRMQHCIEQAADIAGRDPDDRSDADAG